jgi:hypothetical protein
MVAAWALLYENISIKKDLDKILTLTVTQQQLLSLSFKSITVMLQLELGFKIPVIQK